MENAKILTDRQTDRQSKSLISKFGIFLKKWTISKKILAAIFIAIFSLTLIPIIVTCFYSVPVLDDYTFGYLSHKSISEGGSFLSGVIQANNSFFMNWQGFYTANFIAAAQPFNIDINLYFISNLVVLASIIFAFLYFGKVMLCNIFKVSFEDYIIITLPVLSLFLQFMPSIAEGLYWMDGSLSMLFTSCILTMFGFIINYHLYGKKRYFILAVIIAILMSGSGLIGLLTVILVLATFLIYSLKKKYNCKTLIIAVMIIFFAGLIISVIAPGNQGRLNTVDHVKRTPVTFVLSILKALFYSFTYFGKWSTLCFIAIMILCSAVFYGYAKKSEYNFKNPLLVFVLCYLLYAARMSVELFLGETLGAGRQYNEYYYSFLILFAISILYFVGWLSKRNELQFKINKKKISVVFLVFVLFVFGAGCFNYRVKNMSSVSTGLSFIKGETQQYSKEMRQRVDLYEDNSSKDVVVEPLSVYPMFFMEEPLSFDSNYWTNKSVARYYNKESVVLKK